jgi:hypothetical protein
MSVTTPSKRQILDTNYRNLSVPSFIPIQVKIPFKNIINKSYKEHKCNIVDKSSLNPIEEVDCVFNSIIKG